MKEQAHILLVEDEQHLALGIKYNLEAEGYEVTHVIDGSAAMEQFSQPKPINLVILDIMLPGMSGYAICEELRESQNHVPILFLSARTLPEDRSRGFDVGGNQYLTKPFDLDELISRVRNLLRMVKITSPVEVPVEHDSRTMFEFGDALIDFSSHEVHVDGNKIKLTKLELDLLRYFIDHEGRVISREELLEEVWQTSPYANSRAPDQFIRRLRKAFEKNPSEPRHFITVRDAGYRFIAAGVDQEDAQDDDGLDSEGLDGDRLDSGGLDSRGLDDA